MRPSLILIPNKTYKETIEIVTSNMQCRPGNVASIGKRVCTPCGNDEMNFHFPQQILAEMIHKRQ